ncbi:toll-like receptor 6, partial [Achroia grisella]|uniref:toll-like receptor 6 n=1 Tax=Achroia grisella TaxID=688607 RepID=UPI0027D244FA
MFQGICEEKLDLSNNKILNVKSVANSGCELPLKSLNLSLNTIHYINQEAFSSLESLIELDLSHNNLSYINFSMNHMEKLSYLDLSHNKIRNTTKFDLKNLISLEVLDLSQNAITEIENQSFDDLSNLQILRLNNNLFTNLSNSLIFRNLVKLKTLDIMYTRTIIYKSETFSGLKNLKEFNSSYGELSTIEYGAFKNTGSIEILDLSHNLLEDFNIDNDDIPKIEKIFLNNNRIRIISEQTFLDMINIKAISLENNNILSVEPNAFSSLVMLVNLNLGYNKKLELPNEVFNDMTHLMHVSLKNVKKPFNFKSSKNFIVVNLDLSFCDIISIQSLFIYNVQDISHLNLSSNKIKSVDTSSFQNMPYLTSIDLSHNLITKIEPGSFLKTKQIRSLDLSGNYISFLQFGVFDGLEVIHELKLSNNSLRSFDIKILHKCPLISIITLDDNNIEKLNFKDFLSSNITRLSIGDNMIPCNELVDSLADDSSNLQIVTEKLDYHSDNINGITCVTDNTKISKHNSFYSNVNDTSPVLDSLSSIKEVIDNSVQSIISRNIEDIGKIQKTMENILNSISTLTKVYNESQVITNTYLKQLIEGDSTETSKGFTYIIHIYKPSNRITLSI